MKIKALAIYALFVLAAAATGLAYFENSRSLKAGNSLAAMLPAVDGVVVLDARRFFDNAVPKLLASNQPLLNRIFGGLDKIKGSTAIDIRQFDQVAVGVVARNISGTKYDIDPVMIARGRMDTGALIGAAKLAANGKFSEEKVGDRTIFIFSAAEAAKQAGAQISPAGKTVADKVIKGSSGRIAVLALDPATIVIGDEGLVRHAAEGKSRVSAELLSLLGRRESAIGSFAARLPGGMKAFLPLENDEIGKNIDSIRYLYGSMDIAGDAAVLSATAQTEQAGQAQALRDTLEGLRVIGGAVFGGAKDGDKAVFARLIQNAKVSVKGNEVTLDLQVPQSDIDALVSKIK